MAAVGDLMKTETSKNRLIYNSKYVNGVFYGKIQVGGKFWLRKQ